MTICSKELDSLLNSLAPLTGVYLKSTAFFSNILIASTRERTGLVNLFDKTNKIIIANIITTNAIIIIISIAVIALSSTNSST